MSVDLWTMGSVTIHLRQGYGGQDVKVLPVPIFNVEKGGVRSWCPARALRVNVYGDNVFDMIYRINGILLVL